MDEPNRTCPWCSTPIPAAVKACPKCGAIVDEPSGAAGAPAPETGAETQAGAAAAPAPDEHKAVEPPSAAVRIEMRKIEFEAEIENAGT